jgi:hypothetical protein
MLARGLLFSAKTNRKYLFLSSFEKIHAATWYPGIRAHAGITRAFLIAGSFRPHLGGLLQ